MVVVGISHLLWNSFEIISRCLLNCFRVGLEVALRIWDRCGWDVFGKFMIDILPSWVWEALVIFSPITWFTQIGEGLVSIQSLVYFVVTIASGLFITHLFLEERRFGSARQIASIKRLSQYFLGLSFWISCVVVMQFIPGQFDLTEEKEFSLHEGTIDILSKLPKETYVTFFWSESEDSIP